MLRQAQKGFHRCFHSTIKRLKLESTISSTVSVKIPELVVDAVVSPVTKKTKTIVQSILHGKKDHNGELDIAQAWSKKLSRGKYVHELQIHNVKPEAWNDYKGLIKEHYTRIAALPEFKVQLFGSFSTEVGELEQAIHIWQYNNYPGYTEATDLLLKDPIHQKFIKNLGPMLRFRSNAIMLEFAFWASERPVTEDGIYELRSYKLQPGRLLEWESQWKIGLEARRKYVQPVGAWFTQLGHLNEVHHLWYYPDLQTRKEMREAAWKEGGWSNTVSLTVKMIDSMKGQILRPLYRY